MYITWEPKKSFQNVKNLVYKVWIENVSKEFLITGTKFFLIAQKTSFKGGCTVEGLI